MTKKQLQKKIEQLEQDIATLRLMTRAYMKRNDQLEEDLAVLNESLDCAIADRERWMKIAKKADERRRNYVRHMVSADSGDLSQG